MVELTDWDRRALTGSVLRATKASRALAIAALEGKWPFALIRSVPPAWIAQALWDRNEAVGGIRFGLQRAMLASAEQGRGLAELARSPFGYTVALATLTRGSLEALARVEWVLSSEAADDLLVRHASLEFGDLRYPEQHKLLVHHVGGTERVPVDRYRAAINETLASFGLKTMKIGPTELVISLLAAIYKEAPQLYSGLSASAHGHGWATGNFFDADTRGLKRDDQMVIEYCAYVIEATVHVSNRLITALVPDQGSIDRWVSVREPVLAQLDSILQRRDKQPIGNVQNQPQADDRT